MSDKPKKILKYYFRELCYLTVFGKQIVNGRKQTRTGPLDLHLIKLMKLSKHSRHLEEKKWTVKKRKNGIEMQVSILKKLL